MKDQSNSAERLGRVWPGKSVATDLHHLYLAMDTTVAIKTRIANIESAKVHLLLAARRLGSSFSGLGPAYNARQRANLSDLVRLLDIVANVHRELNIELTGNRGHLSRSKSQGLVASIMYQLANLYECLLLQGAAFSPWSDTIWKHVHESYALARRFDLHRTELKKPLHGAVKDTTIQSLYVRIVMLGLSNPYQLSSADVYRIDKFLDSRIDHVRIGTAKPVESSAPILFVTNPALNAAATAVAIDKLDKLPANAFILDLTKLNRSVRARRQRLIQYPNEQDPDFGSQNKEELRFLFQQLEQSWSGVLKRRHARTESSDNLEVLISFGSILQALSTHGQAGDVATMFSQMANAFGQGVNGPGELTAPPELLISGNRLDVSSSGSRISLHEDVGAKLRVGEIIAWRTTDSEKALWQLGLVRWIKQPSRASTEVGVVHVPGSPVMGSVAMTNPETRRTREVASLCVVSEGARKILAIMLASAEGDAIPVGITVNGTPLKLAGARAALATRLLRVFELQVDEDHAMRLTCCVRKPRRSRTRARQGQIWSPAEQDPARTETRLY